MVIKINYSLRVFVVVVAIMYYEIVVPKFI